MPNWGDKRLAPPLTLAYPFNQYTPEIEATALKYYVACRDSQLGVGGTRSTVESLNKWADQQVHEHKWGVMMAHAIGSGYVAFTDPEIFHNHLRYVKSQESTIWVDTFANVARYIKERNEAKLTVSSTNPSQVTCLLAGTLDPTIYDVPLTLVLETAGATSAHANRAGRELPVRVAKDSIQIDAPPAKDSITITWR